MRKETQGSRLIHTLKVLTHRVSVSQSPFPNLPRSKSNTVLTCWDAHTGFSISVFLLVCVCEVCVCEWCVCECECVCGGVSEVRVCVSGVCVG